MVFKTMYQSKDKKEMLYINSQIVSKLTLEKIMISINNSVLLALLATGMLSVADVFTKAASAQMAPTTGLTCPAPASYPTFNGISADSRGIYHIEWQNGDSAESVLVRAERFMEEVHQLYPNSIWSLDGNVNRCTLHLRLISLTGECGSGSGGQTPSNVITTINQALQQTTNNNLYNQVNLNVQNRQKQWQDQQQSQGQQSSNRNTSSSLANSSPEQRQAALASISGSGNSTLNAAPVSATGGSINQQFNQTPRQIGNIFANSGSGNGGVFSPQTNSGVFAGNLFATNAQAAAFQPNIRSSEVQLQVGINSQTDDILIGIGFRTFKVGEGALAYTFRVATLQFIAGKLSVSDYQTITLAIVGISGTLTPNLVVVNGTEYSGRLSHVYSGVAQVQGTGQVTAVAQATAGTEPAPGVQRTQITFNGGGCGGDKGRICGE